MLAGEEPSYTGWLDIPVNASGWSIIELEEDKTYRFRIRAESDNVDALSDWSDPVTVRTLKNNNPWESVAQINTPQHSTDEYPPDAVYFNVPTPAGYEYRVSYLSGGNLFVPGDQSWTANGDAWANGAALGRGNIRYIGGGSLTEFQQGIAQQGGLHGYLGRGPLGNVGYQFYDPLYGDNPYPSPGINWALERRAFTEVSITSTDDETTEGKSDDKAVFTITREGGDQSQPLQVKLHVPAGTATNSTDYKVLIDTNPTEEPTEQSLPPVITIPADMESVDITLVGLKDDKIEGDETAILCLKADETYRLNQDDYSLEMKIKDGPTVDLDIDSNNDGIIDRENGPDGTDDPVEENSTKPGKIIAVNNDDSDEDGIVDFADGYNWNQNSNTDSDNLNSNELFEPMMVSLEGVSSAAIAKFEYNSSPPSLVNIGERGFYPYSSGNLRIWNKPGQHVRKGSDIQSGGNFVNENKWYPVSELSLDNNTLWIEAIKYSNVVQPIRMIVDPDGEGPLGAYSDTINISIYTTRYLQVNSDSGTSQESLVPIDTLQLSYPTPVFTDSDFTINTIALDADYLNVLADFSINFSLDDAYSDLIKGSKGIISKASVFLNDEELPIQVLDLTPTKNTSYNNSLLKPFDFGASYNGNLTGVEVEPGWNKLKVVAMNSAGLTGSTEYSFEIKLTGTINEDAQTFEGLTPEVSPLANISSTVSGSLKPVAVELLGPEDFLKDIDKVFAGEQKVLRDVIKKDEKYLLGVDVGGGSLIPETFIALATSAVSTAREVKPPEIAPWQEGYKNPNSFSDGFFDGFEAYFVEIKDNLAGAWKAAKGVATWTIDNPRTIWEATNGILATRVAIDLSIKVWNNREVTISNAKQAIDITLKTVGAMESLIADYISDPEETLMQIAAGTSPHLEALPDQVRTALEYSVEIISALSEEIQNLPKYDQGWYTGYAVTTVLSEVLQLAVGTVTTAGTAYVSSLPLKSAKLAKVLSKFQPFGEKST